MNKLLPLIALLMSFSTWAQHCMTPITLAQRVNAHSYVVEGKVIAQNSMWNVAQNMIYTVSEVQLNKVFKGSINTPNIFIVTEGGVVGDKMIKVEPELELKIGDVGIFTMNNSTAGLAILGAKYQSKEYPQAFIRYDRQLNKATDIFHQYGNIQNDLYAPIQSITGASYTLKKKLQKPVPAKAVSASGTITSFSPTTVTSGTKTVLTINGTGFGATQGSSYVGFRFNNDGGASYTLPEASEYISWSNTQIQLEVTSNAGTGDFIVSDGTNTITSATDFECDLCDYQCYFRRK